MTIIYHITAHANWESARASGWFRAPSLANEGFIHCSTGEQLLATANRLFRGVADLVVLCIDTDRVQAEIRYENLEGGMPCFPHVYGPLATEWIRAVHSFPPEANGSFKLPAAIEPQINADKRG